MNKLELKDIVLKKLDSWINPQFDKKIIWALISVGFILISYNNFINLLGSFEIISKTTTIKISLENDSDIIFKSIGIVFVLIGSFFYYMIFVKKKGKNKFHTLKEASLTIRKLLDDNNRIFKSHGPNSSSKNVDELRNKNQLLTWDDVKRNNIVPNNEKIYKILSNIKSYSNQENTIVNLMKNHIEAFKKHVYNEEVDYSDKQFPILFQILIVKYCNNGKINEKYFREYIEWINKFLDNNKLISKYLFGSSLYDKNPNDIDILIYINESDTSLLLNYSQTLNQMGKDFKLKFNIELHQTVFSKSENEGFIEFKNKLLDTKEF